MLKPVASSQFRQDVRLQKRRGRDMEKLKEVLGLLQSQSDLPDSFKDHPLVGKWEKYRDLHIESDWVLIYCIDGEELRLARTGTHSDIFRK